MMLLVFDTETTALVSNSLVREEQQPRIIEFYGCWLDDKGEIVKDLDLLINPKKAIPEEVTRITGIKDEDVRNAPTFKDVANRIAEMISGANAVTAHNLAYDHFVVETEFHRIGMKIEWPIRRICTVEETEFLKGYRLSLSALHEELFGEPFKGAHRAKNDVTALVECIRELRSREIM